MTKTGKSLYSLFLWFLLTALVSGLNAQDLTVEAALTETNIFAGERVGLEITITGSTLRSLERPSLPEIPGLRWLPNRTGQSSNYSYINGRPSVSQTYTYQLIAEDVGSFTVPSITIQANGETYRTNTIDFEILDPKTIDSGEAERALDIYVRIEPSVENPVVGQQIIADVVLYFKNGIEVSSYQATPGWKAEGFWKEELESQQRARASSVILNGVRYQRAQLLQYAIFPTKAGELTLSPFEIIVRLRQTNRNLADPFSLGLAQESKELRTLPVTVNVQPLPEPSRGEFNGAVGDFEISRTIDPSSAFVGESIEIITTINGTGNVPLLNKPEYDYPEVLEEYTPQETSNITRINRQIAGSKTFTDIVIARNEGNFTIPEKTIAIYNPASKRYEYTTLPALNLEARNDPRATTPSLEELRLDVEPITGLASWSTSSPYVPLHRNPLVWTLIALPFVILMGAFAYKSYFDKMNHDQGFARSQKAKSRADSTLQKASGASSIKEGYYLIELALIQFITDKLNLPEAGWSTEQLITKLNETGGDIPEDTLRKMLNKCETIAYAPNASQEAMEEDISKARELIKEIGKAL